MTWYTQNGSAFVTATYLYRCFYAVLREEYWIKEEFAFAVCRPVLGPLQNYWEEIGGGVDV